MRCEFVKWIDLAQDMSQWQAVVNVVMKLWVLWKTVNFLINWAIISFLISTLRHRVS